MDKSPRRLGSEDVPSVPVTAELEETNSYISELSDDKEVKSESKLTAEKSNTRTMSPLAKQKEIPSAAANSSATKSKIPAMKRQTNSGLYLKNNSNIKANTNQTGATQRTAPRISLWNKATNKAVKVAQTSNSRASLVETFSNKNQSTYDQVSRSFEKSFPKRAASNLSRRSTPSTLKKVEPKTSLRKITSNAGDYNKLDILEKKLVNTQTEFFSKLENMKANSNLRGKSNTEYKFVSLIQNDAGKLLIKEDHLKKMPHKLPANSVGDFKEKIQNRMIECFSSITTQLKESSENVAGHTLQEFQDSSLKVVLELADDLCASYKDDTVETPRMMEMQKEIHDLKKSLKTAETKLIEHRKRYDEQMEKLESEFKTKASDELSRKDVQIKDLQKKIKTLDKQIDGFKSTIQNFENDGSTERTHLQEELKSCRDSVNVLQKKLSTSEQNLSNERKELKAKNEYIKKLESDLERLTMKHETDNKTSEYLRQINELHQTVNSLERENSTLSKKIECLIAEISSNNELLTKLQEAEKQIENLEQQLAESKSLKADKPECSKDAQNELAKFRQSESEKRREIEKLKLELSKALFNIAHLEDQIRRDEQLLEVRSELITSLQENDKNQRIQMEELFAQVGEKNYAVNELNTELRNKSGEFRDLYSAISAKQMELSKQKHQIKLLEESNERSQMLRVQQEEKIGRMEEDIAHLKQTIALYQANILSSATKLIYTPAVPRSHEDCNENFYYYTSERKRKRQVDISVRKYEA